MGILSCPPQGTKPSLNESPSEKEGKWHRFFLEFEHSLKALNESPSEKEGKYRVIVIEADPSVPQ